MVEVSTTWWFRFNSSNALDSRSAYSCRGAGNTLGELSRIELYILHAYYYIELFPARFL
jgi:hypothetical protein